MGKCSSIFLSERYDSGVQLKRDFRDSYGLFQEKDTVILGVSPDPANRHLKFIEKHELPFTLLVDEDHKVAELYDVWKLKRTLGKSTWELSALRSLLIKTVSL